VRGEAVGCIAFHVRPSPLSDLQQNQLEQGTKRKTMNPLSQLNNAATPTQNS